MDTKETRAKQGWDKSEIGVDTYMLEASIGMFQPPARLPSVF